MDETTSHAPTATLPAFAPAADAPRWGLRAMALLLIALGIVPTANFVTLDQQQRWWAGAVRSWTLWGVLIGAAALLLGRFATARSEELRARLEERIRRPSPREFARFVAGLTCALGVFFGWLLFHFQGATIDELSEQWQAHLLTTGHLVARAERHDEFFNTMQTVAFDGRWFSHFPIGGPLLQALGLLLHVPWLINPLLAACAGVAVYRFAATVGSELQGRVAALLFAVAPFVLFVAASKLDHVGTLAAVWIALAALTRWHAADSARDAMRSAAVVGLGLGAATMIRPYDGLLATVAVGTFQLAVCWRDATRWKSLLVQALAGALPIAVLLAANRGMTGHPLTFAYDVLNGAEHRPGFHTSPLGFDHTPRHGLYLVSSYLMRLNAALLGWPVPVVGVVAVVMLLQRSASRWDALLLGMLATTFVGYFLYWGEGSFNGPRFLYTVVPVFLIFIARLPVVLRQRARTPQMRAAAVMLVPLWCLAAWWVPVGVPQPFAVWTVAARAQQGETVSPLIVEAVRRQHLENALVFVSDGLHARITARLRALGAPPFLAQQVVGHYDACALLQRLTDAERSGAPPAQQAAHVLAILDEQQTATPIPGLSALEQLALVQDRDIPPACKAELQRSLARGADMARLLPLMSLDSLGRLGGDVVYARDFGPRDELLRDRFPDRVWYTVRSEVQGDSLGVVLEPYRRSAAGAAPMDEVARLRACPSRRCPAPAAAPRDGAPRRMASSSTASPPR
ncbi:MAG: hypothetical protein JWN79_642 [Gemmatimonadetes bacterium]|nr:hypothetical protein [Gemmatimonadota bacterium]